MPFAVRQANLSLTEQYFQLAFTREGTAFNSAVDDRFALSRIQIKPEWTEANLLEVLSLKTRERTRFSLAQGDTADSWLAFRTHVTVAGQDVVLEPQEGRSDPVILRGSNLWDNVSMTVTSPAGSSSFVSGLPSLSLPSGRPQAARGTYLSLTFQPKPYWAALSRVIPR